MDTSRRRLVRGTPDPLGYQRVETAPGENPLVREDLAVADASRDPERLVAFAHLSDLHVMDPQSPTRVEFLERYADPDSPYREMIPLVGTYRPQEIFTPHVVEAMVQAVNELDVEFAISTGDATDACQANELDAYLTLLDGGEVCPDSGDPSRWEGVHSSASETYDVRYWHPDGPPAGFPDDLPRTVYGFPVAPGTLRAAAASFEASGLDVPWFAVHGNHDNMLQGCVPPWPELAEVTVGPRKLVGMPEGNEVELVDGFDKADRPVVARLVDAPSVEVAADPSRRHVTRAEWVGAHVACHGHGFRQDHVDSGTAYYAFDMGPLRGLVLDTVNPHGYWQGSFDVTQFEWLEAQLRAEPGTLFVLFSHHPLRTLINDTGPERRILAEEVADLLSKHSNVILWVNGHTHENMVTAHETFWEVTTASHIDWPQQARRIEILDNRNGTLSIVTTIVDHVGPPAWDGGSSPVSLAGLSRELSANYWQNRDDTRREFKGAGTVADRNVELLINNPLAT
ncbi:TIGR03767 family metallophosphoesterase [Amycolatopsis sp. NPDC059657]|uniref:TIGR03767 family metallophosphoesterase n=1 Tax=Amycolatopsis sp. NPDC059657 TaxID=3346899 RepID=UPI00366C1F5E